MKALILLFDSEIVDEVFTLINLAKIKNYTHFKGLHGSGKQGKKMGTVTWPGTNEMMFLIANEDEVEKLKSIFNDYKENRDTPPPIIFMNWQLTEVIA